MKHLAQLLLPILALFEMAPEERNPGSKRHWAVINLCRWHFGGTAFFPTWSKPVYFGVVSELNPNWACFNCRKWETKEVVQSRVRSFLLGDRRIRFIACLQNRCYEWCLFLTSKGGLLQKGNKTDSHHSIQQLWALLGLETHLFAIALFIGNEFIFSLPWKQL